MRKLIYIVSLILVSNAVFGEDPDILRKGSWNFGIWAGGGSAVDTPPINTTLWLTGLRFGKILTHEKGKHAFRGQLEYVVEIIPAFLIFRESTIYGFDVTPLIFRWNFTGQAKVIPYAEIGAGTLFTSRDFPDPSYRFNFTPQAAVGFHVFTKSKQSFTFSFRFMHISNGGLASPNPGVNTLEMMGGYEWAF
jgi:hypothetical protein